MAHRKRFSAANLLISSTAGIDGSLWLVGLIDNSNFSRLSIHLHSSMLRVVRRNSSFNLFRHLTAWQRVFLPDDFATGINDNVNQAQQNYAIALKSLEDVFSFAVMVVGSEMIVCVR